MDITEEDVEKFIFFKIDQLKLCREAVKSLLGYIKGTFKSAKKNHDIADDVTKDIQRSEFYGKCTEIQHPVDALLVPEEDWEKLYKRIREDIEKKPYYFPPYAIILSALTGMRVGELSVLRWEDICTDSVSGCTYIGICRSETYDTIDKTYRIRDIKNHRNRVYPISPQIQQLFWEIQQLQEAVGIQTPWIFYDPKHDHINKRQITNCLKNKCNAIGIRPKGTHAFRRQINSDMRCEGVSVVIASSLIGNSEAVNEKHYTFDVSGLEEKEHIVEKMNEKRLQKCKK
jgi:integrase